VIFFHAVCELVHDYLGVRIGCLMSYLAYFIRNLWSDSIGDFPWIVKMTAHCVMDLGRYTFDYLKNWGNHETPIVGCLAFICIYV
jgi:hypothetical protein